MLFLLFELDRERYALDVKQIVEVLPVVRIRPIPRASAGIVGVVDYRGTVVPVVDLSEMALGRPSAARMSTRLVLVSYTDANSARRLLGVVAEKATDTLRRDASAFTPSGIANADARYLGPVTTDQRGVVQWVDPAALLPAGLSGALVPTAGERS